MLGKREQDIRNALPVNDDPVCFCGVFDRDVSLTKPVTRQGMEEVGKSGVAASLSTYFEVNLQWSDVTWLKVC